MKPSTINPQRLTDAELAAEIAVVWAHWCQNREGMADEEKKLWARRDWDLRGERSDRANRDNPISGRPGHPGYERFRTIAESWGYP